MDGELARKSQPLYAPRIYDSQGRRLWMTEDEIRWFLSAAASAPGPWRTLSRILTFTGCNPTEALTLTPAHVDLAQRCVHFETVRRSGKAVVRTIPLPDFVVADLDLVHGIEFAQRAADRGLTAPALWPWSHVTVWNKINRLMELARIEPGPHATARGLRHGFATLVLANDVPLDLLQTWMGHSSIYATRRAYDRQRRSSLTVRDYSDVEQRKFADRIWSALLCEASQDSPR